VHAPTAYIGVRYAAFSQEMIALAGKYLGLPYRRRDQELVIAQQEAAYL